MSTPKKVKYLQVGTNLALFWAEHSPDGGYSWGGDAGKIAQSDQIEIPTPFRQLDAERAIVSASLSHIIHPQGSGRWAVEVLDTDEIDGLDDKKALLVKFKVTTHGDSRAAVEGISFFGAVSGKP